MNVSLFSCSWRSNEKRWCRSGDLNSCVVTNSNGTFSGRNLIIHDDKKSIFTVTLQQLEMRDSGWYWCAAGQQQMAVRVSVTPRATSMSHTDQSPKYRSHSIQWGLRITLIYNFKCDCLVVVLDKTLRFNTDTCFNVICSFLCARDHNISSPIFEVNSCVICNEVKWLSKVKFCLLLPCHQFNNGFIIVKVW